MHTFVDGTTTRAAAGSPTAAAHIDVVVVSYRSRETLRHCVAPLSVLPGVQVVVVDNASDDGSADVIDDLDLRVVRAPRNGGFAYGCNLGTRLGSAPYVLLLNPDARIDEAALAALVGELEGDPAVGLVAPRILDQDGTLAFNIFRDPRATAIFSQALFLHRLFPRAAWSDEQINDPAAYTRACSPECVSGACMLIRREALEAVGGLDEGYFLYREDIDLCRALREAGWRIRYTPTATVRHIGGASGSRAGLQPVLARARVRYARAHKTAGAASVDAAGVTLSHLTHALASLHRPEWRRGHLAAARAAVRAARGPLAEA